MKYNPVVLFVGLFVLYSSPLSAQQSFGIEDLKSYVLERNPLIHSSESAVLSAEQEAFQAGAFPDPMVGMSQFVNPIFTAKGSQQNIFSASQRFPFYGKRKLKSEIVGQKTKSLRWKKQIYERDLIFQVSVLYYRWEGVRKALKVLNEYKISLQNHKEVAISRYETGLEKLGTLLKADIEIGQVEEKIANLRTRERIILTRLRKILNYPGEDSLILREESSSLPEYGALSAYLDRALKNNQELNILRERSKQSRLKTALARKQNYPDLSAGVTYFRINPDGAKSGEDAMNFTLSVNVPLWLKRNRARVDQFTLEEKQTDYLIQDKINDLRSEIQAALDQLQNDTFTISLYDSQLIPRANDMLSSIISNYKTGKMNFLDLLDAERTILKLQLERIEKETDYLISTVTLERITGGPKEYLTDVTDK